MSFYIALNLQFLSYQRRSRKQERENCCWEIITDHPGVLDVEYINFFHATLTRWGLLVLKIWCPIQRDPLANWALWVDVERTTEIQTLSAFYHHFFGPKSSSNVVNKNYFFFSSRKPQFLWRSFSSLSFYSLQVIMCQVACTISRWRHLVVRMNLYTVTWLRFCCSLITLSA